MNVLMLTPDAVGSTLLQRLITIYMQFHDFDRPVINLHELTNGLETYYSPEFGREIVSKSRVKSWGYYQTLPQIVEVLDSVDHYKTSRLAHYHIKNRGDPHEHQVPFYQYLDRNFYVISCRRKNIFEHALSMCINSVTKHLNVYTHQDKIRLFAAMAVDPIELDEQAFVHQLDVYRDYVDWSQRYFNVSSFFYYEQYLDNIEQYILGLPIWPHGRQRVTWSDKFGVSFDDWNRCHHIPSHLALLSDLGPVRQLLETSGETSPGDTVRFYQEIALPHWPAIDSVDDFHGLPPEIKSRFLSQKNLNITHLLPDRARQFLSNNLQAYQNARDAMTRMEQLDIIVSQPPIKKQTLAEKMASVKNVTRCLDLYNNWIVKNPDMGHELQHQDLDQQIENEAGFWTRFLDLDAELSHQRPIEMLAGQNDNDL